MAEKFELAYVTFELPNDVSHISQRAFQFDSKKVLNGQPKDMKSGVLICHYRLGRLFCYMLLLLFFLLSAFYPI